MIIDSVLPTPDIFTARRVVCIQPHYDDNDMAAAGTLIQLAKQGVEVIYLTVTDDLMGVQDVSLSDDTAAQVLKRDQLAAARVVGVTGQFWLGYPDAGDYDYFALRRDILKYIRTLLPDFIFTVDPWLSYEGHQDHIHTGLAVSEAVLFTGLTKIASSDPGIDASYREHDLRGIVFYHTREPNYIANIMDTWDQKVAAVRCYEAQFSKESMDDRVALLDAKSRQVAKGHFFDRGEPFKILHPSALHCGL
jgi:N,N'-diacetylchitobiose non-reducing end deacetylase